MRDKLRSDGFMLLAAGVLALALPAIAAKIASSRLHGDVEPTLSRALGEPVTIGNVEASLSGSVRLSDLEVGGLLSASAVEASVGLDSLLSGHLGADEIRIESPRLRTRVDRSGEQRLRRLLQRGAAARRRATHSSSPEVAGGPSRLRRILVTDGRLRVDLEGRGTIVLSEVALVPHAAGVRAVAGEVLFDMFDDGLYARARFERAAADIRIPNLEIDRAVAVGGEVTVTGPRVGSVQLIDAVISKGVDGTNRVELSAAVAGDPFARISVAASGDAITVEGARVPLAPLAPYVPASLAVTEALATGRAEIRRLADGRLAATTDVVLTGASLAHPKVAARPLSLDGHAVVRALADLTADGVAFEVQEARFETGGASFAATGAVAFSNGDLLPASANLQMSIPTTPCMTLLRAIPAPARERLAGLSGTGTMNAVVAMAFDRADPDATVLDVDIDLRNCSVGTEAAAGDPRSLRKPFMHTFPDGSSATVGPGRDSYARIQTIPALVTGAFVAAEDARFWKHDGFDTRQIAASLSVNLTERELLRGGSTITQQLAKNVFLDPGRTFARKLEEAVLAWRLESRLDKREILEVYLNIIELGDGVFGLEQAARYWFDKEIQRLSVREVAFLAALTPAPRTISQRVRATGKVDRETNERVDIVLRHMRRAGVISMANYQRAKTAPLVIRAPRLAAR